MKALIVAVGLSSAADVSYANDLCAINPYTRKDGTLDAKELGSKAGRRLKLLID
jgi:hypothetical protein